MTIGTKVKIMSMKGHPQGTVVNIYPGETSATYSLPMYNVRLWRDGSVIKELLHSEVEEIL